MPKEERQAGLEGKGLFWEMISGSSQGIVFVDGAGVVRFANRAAAEIFGRQSDAMVGAPYELPLSCGADEEIAFTARDGRSMTLLSRCVHLECDAVPGTVHYLDDITEHKKAQERLQESQRQLADAQRVAQLGSWECDFTSGKVQWSEETYRIFGVSRDVPASDQAFLGRVHLDDRGRVIRAVQEAKAQGTPIRNLPYRIVLPDGSIRLLLGSGEVVRDSSGNPVSMVGTCHDVTDSRLAHEALTESEQRFCKIFHAAPALVSITTLAEGIHLEVNETFLRTLGYDRGEVIGRSVHELDLWDNPADFQGAVETLLSKGTLRDREVVWRGKSRIIIGLLSAEILEVSGRTFMMMLVNDITERKKAQEEQSRLAAIVQSSDDAIIGKTLDGIIIDWNRGAERMFGYSASEALGQHIRILLPPGHSEQVAWILEKLKRGERTEHFESEPVTKDGRRIAVSSCISPIFDRNGDLTGAAAIIRDITPQKEAQRQIESLLSRLSARGAELEAEIPELEAFNYSVSHDLRTPLTIISGYCDALDADCGGALGDNCRGYLEEIRGGAQRMNELIDTLLNFSRLARSELKREPVDLSALAQEIAAKMQLGDAQREVRFEIQEGVTAQGDPKMLRIALENLLSNAWKYTSGREVARIDFGVTDIGGSQAYFVRDNGEGFEPKDAEQLFAPFRRLPEADRHKGFGIGLATVQRIIKRHGGRVWAQGEKGRGAKFFFTL